MFLEAFTSLPPCVLQTSQVLLAQLQQFQGLLPQSSSQMGMAQKRVLIDPLKIGYLISIQTSRNRSQQFEPYPSEKNRLDHFELLPSCDIH